MDDGAFGLVGRMCPTDGRVSVDALFTSEEATSEGGPGRLEHGLVRVGKNWRLIAQIQRHDRW